MRHLLGWIFAVGLLFLPASRAHAQVPLGYPGYGLGYPGFGYGYPNYGFAGAYGGYYGGYGVNGLLPAANVYSSGYTSFYAAPGTTSFISGRFVPYPVLAPSVGFPGFYGYGGYGLSPPISGNSRLISTGMFMGLPRPNAGLVRVPN